MSGYRIWIGTFGGGFCRFDEEKGIMEWLTAVEGLSDDNINSIIPGDDGKLWISTGTVFLPTILNRDSLPIIWVEARSQLMNSA